MHNVQSSVGFVKPFSNNMSDFMKHQVQWAKIGLWAYSMENTSKCLHILVRSNFKLFYDSKHRQKEHPGSWDVIGMPDNVVPG